MCTTKEAASRSNTSGLYSRGSCSKPQLPHQYGPDFNANAYFFLKTKKYAHLDTCMNYEEYCLLGCGAM
jgi:hypothetical protein